MPIAIQIKILPTITRIELNVKEGDAIDKDKKNTVEIISQFSSSQKDSIIILLLKQDVKFKKFDLLLEVKTIFDLQPFPEQKIEDDKDLQNKLINYVLPFTSEIIAYLTNKALRKPIILPPFLSQNVTPSKDNK